jgi:ketosteroid isomerase-like protein
MPLSNSELARRGYEAVLRGDFDAVREFLDPNVKWHGGDPTASGACRNREEAIEFMRRAREHRGIGKLVEVIEAGDKVVVVMSTTTGGWAPTLTANLTTFRDGKAVEMVHYPSLEEAKAAAQIQR